MIDYDEDWLIRLIFRFEGSVGLRALLFAVPSGLLAVVLLVLEDHMTAFLNDSGIDAITGSQSWAAATGVLAILLSFRTRQALSRFWEGTGLLHQMRGEWFDSVSCCVTFSRAALASKPEEVSDFRHTLVRLMSLCHGSALEEIADDTDTINTIDIAGLDDLTLKHIHECRIVHEFNRVEVILHLIQTLITKNLDVGTLKIPPPILSRVYQTLSRGFVNLLNAKKITDTRFPFPYAQLIAVLLMVHTILTPVMIADLIRNKAWAFVFTFIPIFGMFSLNFTASQLENPFGNDDNDLPLAHFQDEMNASLLMLLHQNSDHLATLSSSCVLSFRALADSVKEDASTSHVSMVGNIPSMHGDLLQVGSPAPLAPATQTVAAAESPSPSPRPPAASAVGSLGTVPRGSAAASGPGPGPSPGPNPGAAAAAAGNTVAGAAEGTPRGGPSAQARLVKGMDDFNSALQSWTKTVDCQISELSKSFTDLRKISDAMPALLESVQSAAGNNIRVLQDDKVVQSLQAFPAI